jgi:hypothetical protein
MFKTRPPVQELAYQLEQLQVQALARLTDVDLQTVIYPDCGWRVQDIIAHLTVWEEEIAYSLQAYQYNSAYRIRDFDLRAFNATHFEQRKVLPARQVYADWIAIRKRLNGMVGSLKVERLMGKMVYPSGKRGMCIALIGEVIGHQEAHMADILKIVRPERYLRS